MPRPLSFLSKFVLLAALSALPAAALAADGYVVTSVNLRAGPDRSYPVVTVLPPQAGVAVQGCVDGYSWCDVIAGPNRGWVSGEFLQFLYSGQRVYLNDYGPRLGIPFVTFSLGLYWDNYYRARPWYRERDSWARRPMPAFRPLPARRPPPPPVHAPRPPVHAPQPPQNHPQPRPPANAHRPEEHRPPAPSRPENSGGDRRPPARPEARPETRPAPDAKRDKNDR